MDIYNNLLNTLNEEYTTVKVMKQSDRGVVSTVRNNSSGKRYVFRKYMGNGEVYKKLLNVSCPYLPQVYETAEKDGETVVLEEFIQGDTLNYILAGGVLSVAETKRVAQQICYALWTLHKLGAVHRDIKPENVLIRGNDAVLIDFDASRIFKNESEYDTRILGTTGYAAPEQYGISQSDGRADIYALGVLINIMLTGKHPSKELAHGRMGRIVLKCTMTNPKKRYKNILHLMEML